MGVKALLSSPLAPSLPERELEGTLVELLILLALDRFNDFVAGEATAPVREVAAQVHPPSFLRPPSYCNGRTLKAVAQLYGLLTDAQRSRLASHVVAFLRSPDWETRQSALAVLKYLLAVERLGSKVPHCALPLFL